MNKIFFILLIPLIAGCLSSSAPVVQNWNISANTDKVIKVHSKYGVARLSQVMVRSPFDTVAVPVLREDWSIAFDPYNHFAATPSLLLRGSSIDVMRSCGVFSDVVWATSSVRADLAVEIDVSRIALKSEGEGLQAVVGVQVSLINQKDRKVVSFTEGASEIDVKEKRFGEAFSDAYTTALSMALKQL